jgi:intein-encoded DNA endonuclease-like protein
MKLHNEWIAGFVDGEGCFSFSIFRNDTMKSKYQIQGEFTVVQHKRDIQVLYALKEHFGCGSVTVNHGDRYHYRVKNLAHLLQVIIPFFEKYPLNTVKKFQLPVFKELCKNLELKKHLTDAGLEEMRLLVKKLSDLKKLG